MELECLVSGYPRQTIYWLHNAKALTGSTSRYTIQRRDSQSAVSVRQKLIINSFSLEDAGVYQCIAESSLADGGAALAASKASKGGTSSSKIAVMQGDGDKGMVSVGDLVDNAQDTAHLVMGSKLTKSVYFT